MGVLVDLFAKNFLKSKGFWGVAGMVLPTVLNMLGHATGWNIGPEDASTATQLAADAWQVAMGALALWGRWSAAGPLTAGSDKMVTVETPAKPKIIQHTK
jgi:hypothetical protein